MGFSRTLNEGDLHENITIYGQPDYGHLKVERSRGSVPDLCSGNGISSASVYKWRAKFGGMDASLAPLQTAGQDEFVLSFLLFN